MFSKDSPLPVHIDVWYGMGLKPGGELEVLGEAVSCLPVVLVIEVGAAQVIGHQPQHQLLWALRYTEGRRYRRCIKSVITYGTSVTLFKLDIAK